MTGVRSSSDRRSPLSHPSYYTMMALLEEFAAKLVLEVFGAGGAIWGFSEICGLRTKRIESILFWRSVALTVAFLFGLRWLRQLQASLVLHDQKQRTDHDVRNNATNPRTPVQNTRTEDTFMDVMQERSPFGIQLLSFFNAAQEDTDEEEALLSSEEFSCDESTALTSSPRSPNT